MRRAESIVVIAGWVQIFLDRLDLPNMGVEFKRRVQLWLLATPIRDARAGVLKFLLECVHLPIAKLANNGDRDFTCVIPQLYEMLRNESETHPAVLTGREAFMIQNFTMLREARDTVLPGWDEEHEAA